MRAAGSFGLDFDRIQEAIWNVRFRAPQPTGFQTRGLTAALMGHLRTLLAYAAVRQADLEENEAASSEAMQTISMAQAVLTSSRSSVVDHVRLADPVVALMKLLRHGNDCRTLHEAAPGTPTLFTDDSVRFEERT